mgnify:FL=1
MNKQYKISYDYYGDSRDIFSIIKDLEWSVFLCSNHDKFQDERYDILSANPVEKIISYEEITTVENKDGVSEYKDDPIDVVGIVMKKYPSDVSDLPFTGGAIGYLSYDLGNHYEGIEIKKNDINIPLMAFGIYDWAVIVDHHKKNTTLVYRNENILIKEIKTCLEMKLFEKNKEKKFSINSPCLSNITHDEYLERFNKIQTYIKNGDCYQINFSQRFSASYAGDTWDIYNKIMPVYSSPYSAYINMPFVNIMSFSPERFLSYDGNIVETKPIKGTRPVSSNLEINKKLIEELSSSYKERAENLMIVDLLRNDLGKNCEFGSVKVKELFSIETFANVHHLVSTIQGKISKNSNIYKLIRDCFPGGSITGAPKIRAMQIINELEPHNRNVYCGSIGYISFSGTTDLNIAIRTVMTSEDKLYFWGGGGIVYDSEIESEYKETFDKIKPLLDLLKN